MKEPMEELIVSENLLLAFASAEEAARFVDEVTDGGRVRLDVVPGPAGLEVRWVSVWPVWVVVVGWFLAGAVGAGAYRLLVMVVPGWSITAAVLVMWAVIGYLTRYPVPKFLSMLFRRKGLRDE